MAGYISGDTRKVTTHRLVEMKQRGERISMLHRLWMKLVLMLS